MTDEELAAIRERNEHLNQDESWSTTPSSSQGDVEGDVNQIIGEDVPALVAEVERLNTWDGLVSLIDERYPADVMDGSTKDAGPRIVVLVREVARLQGIIAGAKQIAQRSRKDSTEWADLWRDLDNILDGEEQS